MIEPTSFSMPTERRAIREILGDWRWILLYTRRCWAAIAAYTVLGILSSLTALAAGVVTKQLIDFIIARDAAALLPAAGLMVLTSGGSIAFQAVSGRLSARLSLQVSQAIQADVVDRFLSADWLSLQHFRSGDLISRFSSDVASVTASAVSWIPQVVSSAVSFLATFLVILYYDAAMAVIALISAPVLLLASRPLLRRLRAFSVQLRAAEGNRSALLVETFSNADLFKSFGLEALAKDRVGRCQQDYFRIAMEQNRFHVATKILLSILGKCTEFLALGYCLLRLWQGGITFGTMTLFLSQRASLSSAFSSLVGLLPSAVSSAVSAHRIREIASLPRETPGDIPQGVRECSIRLQQVQAAYVPGCDVLHHADFHAEPGEIVALVGPSGQGKTSMIRLILGLLPAASGSALLLDPGAHRRPPRRLCLGLRLPSDLWTRNHPRGTGQGPLRRTGSAPRHRPRPAPRRPHPPPRRGHQRPRRRDRAAGPPEYPRLCPPQDLHRHHPPPQRPGALLPNLPHRRRKRRADLRRRES